MKFFRNIFGFFLLPTQVWGKEVGCENPPCIQPSPTDDSFGICRGGLRGCILQIISYFLTFVGIIAVAALIYYGFLWLVSGGNEEQIETGKKGIIYVALGIFVILFSYVLVAFLIDAGIL